MIGRLDPLSTEVCVALAGWAAKVCDAVKQDYEGVDLRVEERRRRNTRRLDPLEDMKTYFGSPFHSGQTAPAVDLSAWYTSW